MPPDRRPAWRCARLPAVALAVTAFLAPPARGALDVVVRNGDRVRGSFVPAAEIETFRMDVPRGAAFDVRIRAVDSRKAGVAVLVTGPDGDVGADGGRSAAVRRARAGSSGEHLVHVGTLDGATPTGYRLNLRWRGRRKFTERPTISAAQATTIAVPAEEGAQVTVTVAPAGASSAQPSFSSLTSPGAATVSFAPTTRHRFTATATGEHVLTLDDGGDAGGEVVVTALVRPPRMRGRRLAATTREIPSDATVVAAAVLGAEGGRLVAPDDAAAPGATLDLPPDALRRPTLVALATGSDLAAPSPERSARAGATLVVCPVGATLLAGRAATLVVPFGEAPPESVRATLRVLRQDGAARVATPLDGVTVDAGERTATVPAPRLAAFQPYFVSEAEVPPGFRVDGDGAEGLGNSVALAGDWVLLGAPNADGPGPLAASGRVRLLERVGETWIERTPLRSAASASGGLFGTSVATLFDAARNEWTAAVGAPGERTDPELPRGIVHFYALRDGAWVATDDLACPLGYDGFGSLVRLDGDTLAATAFIERASAPDVLGEGYPFVFRRTGDAWKFEAALRYTRHGMALHGDRLAALGGVVHERDGTQWSEPVAVPEPGYSASTFGWSIDFAGDRVVVHRTPPGTAGALGLIDTYEKTNDGWTLTDELDVEDLREVVAPRSHGAALVLVGDTLVATAVRPALLTVHRRAGKTWRRDFSLSAALPTVSGTATELHEFQTSVAFDGRFAVGGWCVPRGAENAPDGGTAIVYEIP